MIALLTSHSALANQLGADAPAMLQRFAKRYAELQDGKEQRVAYAAIDDEAAMRDIDLDLANDLTPSAYVSVLRKLAAVAEKTHHDALDAALILGGDSIVPFWRLANPVRQRALDPDELVLSDNPYGLCTDDSYLEPKIPVGRICDFGDAKAFEQDLERVLGHLTQRQKLTGSFAAINEQWISASGEAQYALSGVLDAHICPFYAVNANRTEALAKRLLYFNLHGFNGEPTWSGYDEGTDQFIDAVSPASFRAEWVDGAMALSEACYGAQVIGRNAGNSCALAAQHEGVAGFIAPTGLAFGSWQRPILEVADSDRLAPKVLTRLSDGVPAGEALRAGRLAFMADIGDRLPNTFEQKTALQYVLYGDPTLSAA